VEASRLACGQVGIAIAIATANGLNFSAALWLHCRPVRVLELRVLGCCKSRQSTSSAGPPNGHPNGPPSDKLRGAAAGLWRL